MANRAQRFCIDGGDRGVWGPKENEVNLLGLGTCTAYLYDDAGTLTLGKGRVGLDDGSQKCSLIVDTATAVSLAGLTASRWAQVELSRVNTTLVIEITTIAGASDPAALPASFTGAYDGDKQGYYVVTTKRVVGLAWINAGGNLEGIINCLSGPDYVGYSTSDDANDAIYYFKTDKALVLPLSTQQAFPQSGVFTALGKLFREIYPVTTAASSFAANIPAKANWIGKRIKVVKVDTGAGVCTVIPNGAETFKGIMGSATAFPLRKVGDYIELENDGTNIYVVDSWATIDTAAFIAAGGAPEALVSAHGTGIRISVLGKYLVNLSTEKSYAAGDLIAISGHYWPNNAILEVHVDATNITFAHNNIAFEAYDKGTINNYAVLTMTKWGARIIYRI